VLSKERSDQKSREIGLVERETKIRSIEIVSTDLKCCEVEIDPKSRGVEADSTFAKSTVNSRVTSWNIYYIYSTNRFSPRQKKTYVTGLYLSSREYLSCQVALDRSLNPFEDLSVKLAISTMDTCYQKGVYLLYTSSRNELLGRIRHRGL
jgi:hypothetical protein